MLRVGITRFIRDIRNGLIRMKKHLSCLLQPKGIEIAEDGSMEDFFKPFFQLKFIQTAKPG